MAEQIVELAPGESKQVSFEAVPSEARVYQVTVDGLSGSFVAKRLILEFKGISIFNLNDIPFSEAGRGTITYPCVTCGGTGKVTVQIPVPPGYAITTCYDCKGTGSKQLSNVYWARLREPIVKNTLRGAVTIKGRNTGIRFVSDENYKGIYAYIFYAISGGPSFEGNGVVPWVTGPEGYYKIANPPWDFSITPSSAIAAGSWKPKLYSARIQVGGRYYDGSGTAPFCQFYVLDFLQCTGSGSVSV